MAGTNFFDKRVNVDGDIEYVALSNEDGNIMLTKGTTVPTDANSGYGAGCVFIDTDGGVGATYYVNEGSATSCDFNVSAGSTGDITAVTAGAGMTGGGASGAVTLNVINTDGKITVGANTLDITADTLVNADINSAAAIAWSKVATSTDISSTGKVTDLTITSEVQGDILFFDGTNWVRLAPGTSGRYLQTQGSSADPQWASVTASTASGLNSPFSIEGGTYDPATTVTSQTTSAAALTIPDLAGTAQEWMFTKVQQTILNKLFTDDSCTFGATGALTKTLGFDLSALTAGNKLTLTAAAGTAQTLTLPNATDTLVGKATTDSLSNKTLAAVKIATADGIFDAGGDEYMVFTEDTTPVTYIGITSGDAGVAPIVSGAGEANTNLMLKGIGTGNVEITDGGDITAKLVFELDGSTTSTATTLAVSQSGNVTLTLPDSTDTLVGKATTDTLTNKTIDALGTGNVITNINADELDPVGDAAFGVPFVITKTVTNLAAAGTNIISANKKLRVLDAWFVSTSADSGTIAVHAGQVGSIGGVIVETMTIAADDLAIVRATGIDDDEWELAENGGLVAVGDGGASIDGTINVLCMRIN